MNKWFNITCGISLLMVSCDVQENPNVDPTSEDTLTSIEAAHDTTLARDLSFTTDFQTGDVLFVNCNSSFALPISLATHSEYTHCGVLYRKGDEVFVIEASDTSRLLPLVEFFENTADDRVLALRLKKEKKGFSPGMLARLEKALPKWLGKPYDPLFMWDNERLYCSELVYKLYHSMGIELCPVRKIKDFDFTSAEVKEEVQTRYHGKIPYEEPVVAPVDLVRSRLLDTVYYAN